MVLGEPLKACEHKVGLLSCPVKLGGGTTCTVVSAVAVQPFNVPVTVYTCMLIGPAFTVVPVVELKPKAGDQE